MVRVVGRTYLEPYKLVIGGEEKFLCRCGLTFWYDDSGMRHSGLSWTSHLRNEVGTTDGDS